MRVSLRPNAEWAMLERHRPRFLLSPIARAEEMKLSRQRRVGLFTSGRNQMVRIPRGFELPGESAIIRKEGDRLIVEPAPRRSLLTELSPLDEEFLPIRDAPAESLDLVQRKGG